VTERLGVEMVIIREKGPLGGKGGPKAPTRSGSWGETSRTPLPSCIIGGSAPVGVRLNRVVLSKVKTRKKKCVFVRGNGRKKREEAEEKRVFVGREDRDSLEARRAGRWHTERLTGPGREKGA